MDPERTPPSLRDNPLLIRGIRRLKTAVAVR
jgi:hypothetical protein